MEGDKGGVPHCQNSTMGSRECGKSSSKVRSKSKSQGAHLPGKPGKVREFQSGQGKVTENGKSQGKVRGSEIRCVFSSFNTPKLCPAPRWGSLRPSPSCYNPNV